MDYFAYSQKEFIYKYVVMLSDSDQFKHMSFANYLKLMFLATDALFIDVLKSNKPDLVRLNLVNSRMQFKLQTVPGDHILIKVNASKISGQGFSLLYTFVIEGSGELVALGYQKYDVLPIKSNASEVAVVKEIKKLLQSIAVDEENLLFKY